MEPEIIIPPAPPAVEQIWPPRKKICGPTADELAFVAIGLAAANLAEKWNTEAQIARNWPEDASHENGNYQNKCCHCNHPFIGHKRRVTCRVCVTEWKAKWDAMTEAERATHIEKQRNEVAAWMATSKRVITVLESGRPTQAVGLIIRDTNTGQITIMATPNKKEIK